MLAEALADKRDVPRASPKVVLSVVARAAWWGHNWVWEWALLKALL